MYMGEVGSGAMKTRLGRSSVRIKQECPFLILDSKWRFIYQIVISLNNSNITKLKVKTQILQN